MNKFIIVSDLDGEQYLINEEDKNDWDNFVKEDEKYFEEMHDYYKITEKYPHWNIEKPFDDDIPEYATHIDNILYLELSSFTVKD